MSSIYLGLCYQHGVISIGLIFFTELCHYMDHGQCEARSVIKPQTITALGVDWCHGYRYPSTAVIHKIEISEWAVSLQGLVRTWAWWRVSTCKWLIRLVGSPTHNRLTASPTTWLRRVSKYTPRWKYQFNRQLHRSTPLLYLTRFVSFHFFLKTSSSSATSNQPEIHTKSFVYLLFASF